MNWIKRSFERDFANTGPDAEDPRLLGRTYAIPFEVVWKAAFQLMGGGLRGWRVVETDDQEGVISGLVEGRIERLNSSVTIRISLDQDAQTRVDAVSSTLQGPPDLGSNARRLARFFNKLDQSLESAHGRPIAAVRLEPTPGR